ncbi:NEL-type E3 ubiquitin ligase domain-containing protein [Pseudomonas plecoglossicida]|uniref:NEL-type E3 ubiquitin ligase domain-containing protein n=1 Tax=Pseudomonas plecoglossicida TaxID=70775 RepID=UPI003977B3BC
MGNAQATHDLLEQAAQDAIIAKRLPGWMCPGNPEHMAALGQALKGSLDCRYRLQALLQQVAPVERFAAPLLKQALQTRYGVTHDLDNLWMRAAFEKPLSTYAPIRVPLAERIYYQIPLLEAALRSFTAAEATAGGQAPGNGLYHTDGTPLVSLSAVAFASLVRELDLGERYQQHLDSQLATPQSKALLADSLRHGMLIDAMQARHQGVLDGAELELLVKLWRDGWLSQLNDSRVLGKRLEVLGCPLQQIVVLDVRDETFAPLHTGTQRVLVYIPGDPHGAWSAHDDLQRFVRRVLGQRLRTADYRQFFARFVRARDSQVFFSRIVAGYDDLPLWANIDLDERMHPMGAYVFKYLAALRVAQVKDDAEVFAPSVAKLDREVQQAHEQRLEALGLTALAAASLYLPALGTVLLAMLAWKWLDDVFQSVSAWQEGDTREALDHVTEVATDLAVIAATGIAVSGARRLWQRSLRVDGMPQARLENGSECLWDGDLGAFRGEAPPADAVSDAQGVWRLGEQAWVTIDEHFYRVVQRSTDGHWQLLPRNGHGPLLVHNGAGAWRLWYEQPLQWDTSHYLFRRLGGQLAKLQGEQVDEVLGIHDLGSDQLRAWHVLGRAPDPALLDSAQRVGIDQRIRTLVARLRAGQQPEDSALLAQLNGLEGAAGLCTQALADLAWAQRRRLFEQVYQTEAQVLTGDPSLATLRRVFPGLHWRAAQALLARASAADRERLQLTGRIPLRLAEAARQRLAEVRRVRVFEALHWDTPQNLDLARVVLALLEYLPAANDGIRWRLFNGGERAAPVAAMQAGSQARDLVFEDGLFQRIDPQGLPVGEAGELFEVISPAYGHDLRAALQVGEPFAHNLRVLLTRQALARRQAIELLLSPSRPSGLHLPSRLADGRIGYPLSGRRAGGSPSAYRPGPILRRVRYLYPSFTDDQVFAWVEHARRSVIGLERTLQQYEQTFDALTTQLRRWVHAATTTEERENRRRLRYALRSCWQQMVEDGAHEVGPTTVYRWDMADTHISSLPAFSEQVLFAHVHVLTLQNMQLEQVPESFLRAFPNLRGLEMPNNRLTRIPQALLRMPNLMRLSLQHNRIRLDPGQSTIIASCPNLVFVDLSRNPLGRPFSLSGLPRLRELRLADTGIRDLPFGLAQSTSLRVVDLRDNLITSMPEGFYESPLWVEHEMHLSGNPFSEPEAQRLHAVLLAEMADGGAAMVPARLRWMDAAGVTLRTELSAHWEALEAMPNATQFFNLIERVMETQDFQHLTGARYLAGRVLELLRAMKGSDELRDLMFNDAEQLTCQDSVALRFSDLELRLLAWRARAQAAVGGEEQALLRLGRQMWRLDEVDQFAQQDVLERELEQRGTDPIDITLAYRLGLREQLDLPVLTSGMTYRTLARVEAQELARAQNWVLTNETGERLADSLVVRDFWQAHLRATYVARFESIDTPFHERLEALQADFRVPEAERLAEIQRVANERQVAERDLMLTLTLDALDRQAGQGGA